MKSELKHTKQCNLHISRNQVETNITLQNFSCSVKSDVEKMSENALKLLVHFMASRKNTKKCM